eukprot:c11141_g1_i1.p1 GENE.c11141_g1_i1~~c11141_g1_i1.p1  ORF type:complete len:584 (+),score=112.81 c11141_g1_i1:49-1752(+)
MKCLVLIGLLCLTASAVASDRIGNPWQTTAFVKTSSNALIQDGAEDPSVGGSDALTDEELVSGKFGSTPVNLDNLKTFIKRRGLSDLGLIGDLIARSACIVRLEASFGAELNPTNLNDFLSSRELSALGGRDETFDRACDYLVKENVVRAHLQRPVADISTNDLQVELSKLGFISSTGSKAELVYRLGKAVTDLNTIRKLTGDGAFDTSSLREVLKARGLPVEGTTNVLLDRLASYLVDVSSSSGAAATSSRCDMVVASSVCVEGGKKIIAPDAVPRGLIGHWDFDDTYGLDSSGLGHHAKQAPAVGEGLHGVGASARFDATSMLEIQHSDHFSSQDFCVSLWLYLLADSTGDWRTLLHKGNRDHERTPTLFLEPQTRGLEFFVSTSDTTQPSGERLWSNTFIPLRRWTHIAACAEGRNLRLFINGILDAENTTIGTPVMNQGPMYVGNDPWRTKGGVASYVDELRYYTRALSADEIQAQAQHPLGGVEPVFVELGCMGCTLDSCPKSCRRGYRLCTSRDLFSGAYQVARGMGWANSETRIWSAEDVREGGDTPDASGLCMCCREEE